MSCFYSLTWNTLIFLLANTETEILVNSCGPGTSDGMRGPSISCLSGKNSVTKKHRDSYRKLNLFDLRGTCTLISMNMKLNVKATIGKCWCKQPINIWKSDACTVSPSSVSMTRGVPPQITAAPLEARVFSIWRCCYSWWDPLKQHSWQQW